MSSQRTIISIQAVRAFAYGFGSVVLGATLARDGYSPLGVGLVLTAITAGMALGSVAVGGWADRLGRRNLYRALLLLMAVSGCIFALTSSLPWLLLAALTGTLSPDSNDSGPISTLEQGMLGRSGPASRTRTYGRYNAAAYIAAAIGSLAAGLPGLLGHWRAPLGPGHAWFAVFIVAAGLSLLLARRLDPTVELELRAAPQRRLGSPAGRRILLISGLFGLDSLGGGFLAQSFIAYWLHWRFGLGLEVLGPVFFVGGIMQAFSALLAAPLAGRFGLVRTVALSQVPGNILILAVAFSPSPLIAVPCVLFRFLLSQADIPARQAFVMTVVPASGQMAAAAATNTARYVLRPAAPLAAGALMQAAVAAPFVAGAVIKLTYDVAFYLLFRNLEVDGSRAERLTAETVGT